MQPTTCPFGYPAVEVRMIAVLLWVGCTSPETPAPVPVPAPVAVAPAPAWRVDLHVDTLSEAVKRGVGLDDAGLEAGLPALGKGEVNVVVNVLWPPRTGDHEAITRQRLGAFEVELGRLSDRLVLARTPAQADAIVASGRVATLLALEGAHGIAITGEVGLRDLHTHGLTMLGLTWSLSNRFAGSSGDGGGGLTEAGRALVATAQQLGILVDVSHASDQATLQTCAVSQAPLVASHSNVRAVYDVPRNLTEEAIRCIAGTGGLIGVMFHGPFVAEEPSIGAVADHVEALVRLVGVQHVGVGSDWDGAIAAPGDLGSAAALPALWAELSRRGLDAAAIDQIRGGNFRRVWTEATASLAPR